MFPEQTKLPGLWECFAPSAAGNIFVLHSAAVIATTNTRHEATHAINGIYALLYVN